MQHRVKLLASAVAVATVSVLLLIWIYPSMGDFRVDNPNWNGIREFVSELNATPVSSFKMLEKMPQKTALIVVPYEPLATEELETLKRYVEYGGLLLVLDDYGFGNQILEYLGLEVRFSGKPLLDPLFNYKSKWLPKVVRVQEAQYLKGVGLLVLNHATALTNVSRGMVVAWSSSFSYIDQNLNGQWDVGEPKGPLPIAAICKVRQGTVVVIADPSILINSMIALGDNLKFIENLVKLHTMEPEVYVDQKHLPITRLEKAKTFLEVLYKWATYPTVSLALAVGLLTILLRPLWTGDGNERRW